MVGLSPDALHARSCLWHYELGAKRVPFDAPYDVTLSHICGRGTFGVVCAGWIRGSSTNSANAAHAAEDENVFTNVAIKKIDRPVEREDYANILREIRTMRMFKHPNLLSLLDVYSAPTGIYLVMPFSPRDLKAVLLGTQALSEGHFRYWMAQLLDGLVAMHAAHVVHRDLKPNNLLLDADNTLKICDFGLTRYIPAPGRAPGADNDVGLSEYVVTRWYRAPELLGRSRRYTTKIDLWAVGCIFAEMFLRTRSLLPGLDGEDQLHKIVQLVGMPSDDQLRQTVAHPALREHVRRLEAPVRPQWAQVFAGVAVAPSLVALSLLERLLTFDPSARASAVEARAHDFFPTRATGAGRAERFALHAFDDAFERETETRAVRARMVDDLAPYRRSLVCDATSTRPGFVLWADRVTRIERDDRRMKRRRSWLEREKDMRRRRATRARALSAELRGTTR